MKIEWHDIAGLCLLLMVAGFAGLVSGCGHQPPRVLSEIHGAAKARIEYHNYSAYDYRYIPMGTQGAGNCATFAYTVLLDLEDAGQPAYIVSCTTTDGNYRHVYVRSGDWALDVRFKAPTTVDQLNCI